MGQKLKTKIIEGKDFVNPRPTREVAEQAVRTLIQWAGDNPDREGLKDTPSRLIKAFEEYYAGYQENPASVLSKTFEEVADYTAPVILKDIEFTSHCEHHMAPIIGRVHLAYIPNKKVVGISKLVRLVEIFAKRLTIQEGFTAQIADTLDKVLEPTGVAVVVSATHQCMVTRGVKQEKTITITREMRGLYKTDCDLRKEFLSFVND